MIRRRPDEEHVNHDRWVISYADFITLLFAFFVVMYSISSVNDGKYRVLSDSLVQAFQDNQTAMDIVPVGDIKAGSGNHATMIPLPVPGNFPNKEDYKYGVEGLFDDVPPGSIRLSEEEQARVGNITRLTEEITAAMRGEISDGNVKVLDKGHWLELSIQSGILFSSGSATLSPEARQVLDKPAQVLLKNSHKVQVEGYTDNMPIETEQFPSNWELSAARAAAVVRWLVAMGMDPARLSAVGYGEQQPLASNDTEEGRQQNRRIKLIVSTEPDEKERKRAAEASQKPKLNYKIGGEAVNSATVAPLTSTSRAPLKIMTLEDGRLLFGAEPAKGTPAQATGAP